jgi:hypothetical protein
VLVFPFASCGNTVSSNDPFFSEHMPMQPPSSEDTVPMQSLDFESYTIFPGKVHNENSLAVIRSVEEMQPYEQHVRDFITRITEEVEKHCNQETLMSNSGILMMATRSYFAMHGLFTEAFFQKGVAVIKTMTVPEGTLRVQTVDVRTDGEKLYIDLQPVYWLHSGTDALDVMSVLIGLETDMQFDMEDIVIEIVDAIVATE